MNIEQLKSNSSSDDESFFKDIISGKSSNSLPINDERKLSDYVIDIPKNPNIKVIKDNNVSIKPHRSYTLKDRYHFKNQITKFNTIIERESNPNSNQRLNIEDDIVYLEELKQIKNKYKPVDFNGYESLKTKETVSDTESVEEIFNNAIKNVKLFLISSIHYTSLFSTEI